MSSETPYLVPALERGLRLLEYLAAHPGGVTTAELGTLQLPSASLYRLLSTLVHLHYVEREEGDRYRLSRKLLSLGYRSIDEAGLTQQASGQLRKLRDRTGETAFLAVLYGREGVVIDEVVSTQPVKVTVQIGHHFPLHTAAPGKAILAFLPEREREELLRDYPFTRFTAATLDNATAFAHELETVRENGVAFDRGEELEEIRCAGAPVFDRNGRPVAAIWISAPRSRLGDEKLEQTGREVRRAADAITRNLVTEGV